MSFDELQAAWQSQSHGPRVTLDTDILLREVQRNQRHLARALFWRDLCEIVVAAFLTVFFTLAGLSKGDWPLFVLAIGCAFVGIFMLVDRWIQRRRRPSSDDTLQDCIQASLAEVDHQIWLLTNIFWWYLLPIAIGLTVTVANTAWKQAGMIWQVNVALTIYAVFCGLLFWGVYWMNQAAVSRHLAPRRDELIKLSENLKQEHSESESAVQQGA